MEPAAKRRKVRKGTHSCWECKRRKVRCILTVPTDDTCITCKRRGLKCVSQDLEPPDPQDLLGDGNRRLDQFEVLLNELSEKVKTTEAVSQATSSSESAAPAPFPEMPTPASSVATPQAETRPSTTQQKVQPSSVPRSISRTSPSSSSSKNERIATKLLAAVPSKAEIALIEDCIPGYAWLCFESSFVSRTFIESGLQQRNLFHNAPRSGLAACDTNTHPVLIASKMLLLSSGMLYIAPSKMKGLREPVKVTRARLIETAIRLVTTDDTFLGSIGGLECVMREGLSHLEVGNLRRGWTTFRRAITIGQLLGVHRNPCPSRAGLGVGSEYDPQILWFRVVWMDRFLSILLGLPHSNAQLDPNWGADVSQVPEERIERIHAQIAGEILERHQMGLSHATVEKTMELDRRLVDAAQSLPDQFWRLPPWKNMSPDSELAFQECLKARDQLLHYSLLNQLHLPFLLCPESTAQAAYSRAACMTASREVLSRVAAFRSFNSTAACCRMTEFLALIAAMTLMLAHIDAHCRSSLNNVLVHQRLSDRGVIEQALDAMQEISKLNKDVWAAKCADVLRHLLHVEADAARGQPYCAENVNDAQVTSANDEDAIYITVPYFPTIKIAKQGITASGYSLPNDQVRGQSITLGGLGSVQVGGEISAQVTPSAELQACGGSQSRRGDVTGPEAVDQSMLSTGNLFPDQSQFGDLTFSDQTPGAMVAPTDFNAWGFQGLDLAFLDNLTWTMGT